LRACDYLLLADADLTAARKAGFTTQLIAPGGGIISGAESLVNLSGLPRRACVVRPAVALGLSFKLPGSGNPFGGGGGGGYPGTLLGTFAQIRQTFLDVGYYRSLKSAFDSGSARRPPVDDALAALIPVANGSV